MSKYIASVDAGNGGVNAFVIKGKGKPKTFYEPSVRAAASGDSLGISQFEMNYSYTDWNGHRYVTGDDVIRVTRRGLERHIGQDRYGNEMHQFLVANALAKLGVGHGKDDTVDLTLFSPPGFYIEAKQVIEKHFGENEGIVEITLKGDETPRTWKYSSISVWPEGIGAAACFAVDAKGDIVNSDVLSGDVVILDIGAFTLDAIQMTDGNFNPESLSTATWDNGGVDVHLRQPIVKFLKEKYDDFAQVSVDDVDYAIRLGLAKGDYIITKGGVGVDVKPLIDRLAERYAEWIANNIIDGVFNGLRGIKALILIGGGTALTETHLKKWYTDKLLEPEKFHAAKGIHPVNMNAIGGLRLALMKIKQQEMS